MARRKKKDPQMSYIYALIDPTTKEIRYIGFSKNPTSRLSHHITVATRDEHKSVKSGWIRGLLVSNQKPKLVILERVFVQHQWEREYYWVKLALQLGCDLTNDTGSVYNKNARDFIHFNAWAKLGT